MPPLKTYTFKHKVSETISPITISIHGDLQKAWDYLTIYVFAREDWEYVK